MTRFFSNEGHCCRAISTYLAAYSTPSGLSAWPRALGKTGSSDCPLHSRSHARKAVVVCLRRGVQRSFHLTGASEMSAGAEGNILTP